MGRKRHTAEEIVSKLRQVDVRTAQGRTVAQAIRQIGVTEVAYYRWRNEYGGLKSDQVKRMKELEMENARLRRAVSKLSLEKLILKEAASGPEGQRHIDVSRVLSFHCGCDRPDKEARRPASRH
jgi:transposase-like protein